MNAVHSPYYEIAITTPAVGVPAEDAHYLERPEQPRVSGLLDGLVGAPNELLDAADFTIRWWPGAELTD